MSVPQDVMQEIINRPSLLQRLRPSDWIWALLVIAGTAFAFMSYSTHMDVYEQGILLLTAPSFIALGWYWRAFQPLTVAVTLLSLIGIWLYGGDYGNADNVFGLKYLFSSQSAVMWMSALFVLATVFYFTGLFVGNAFIEKTGSAMTWVAITMGFVGLMVRWYESYLVDPEFGHIPVSNLYEVFILFCLITGMLYMYYEAKYRSRAMGGFVLLVISAAVAFLLWYSFDRGAHEIQPLVPALKSYWMKIHVPANFVGYGAFALSAMVSVAYLLKHYYHHPSRTMALMAPLTIFLVSFLWLFLTTIYSKETGFAWNTGALFSAAQTSLLATAALTVLGWLCLTDRAQKGFPTLEMLDELSYKSIALGFAFFTIATILGAMWAAEAWGGYWSWDPKETWALIVWLNYAAWLHFRFSKGWQGTQMAWWAIAGLFITLFAFLGVNMFLSGLHSYGEL